MTVTIEDDMPTAAWFAALPEDRKTKAIHGSYLWKLAHDEERLWGKLGPYADHSEGLRVFRNYRTNEMRGSTYNGGPIDLTVAEMLDQVPDMLMDGFVLMASSALLHSHEMIAKVLRKYAPEVIAELTEEYDRFEPYHCVDRQMKRMLAGRDRATAPLRYEGDRGKLWALLRETREADPEAAAEIDRAWRLNARAEFLLREALKATAGDF
jgi:hypothetical protein